MSRGGRLSVELFIGVLVIAGLLVVYGYHPVKPAIPHDYILPHDNFDSQTMKAIREHLNQYNVSGTPQDHEVFMVTGGLGIANPRITEWDSGGNMDFMGNQAGDRIYSFQFTSQSPATWKTGSELKPVPWVLKHSKSGMPYYEWDMPKYLIAQFYFKKDNTYVILKVDYAFNKPKPAFPTGLPGHLVPIGNPVVKQVK